MAVMISRAFKILLLICLTFFVLINAAGAAERLDVKGYINKQDIDKAKTRDNAIQIDGSAINWSGWALNTGGSPITFSKATVQFAWFLPGPEFGINETMEAGIRKDRSGSVDLPAAVLSLKGFYNIKVSGYDQQGDLVAERYFWIKIGEGSPLTGVIGGLGLVLMALALGLGVSSALASRAGKAVGDGEPAKKIGRGRRRLATALAVISAPFLFVALGVISPLEAAPYIGGMVLTGGGMNGLVRLLAKLPG